MTVGEAILSGPSGVAVDFGGTKIAALRLRDGTIADTQVVATDGAASAEAQIGAIVALLDDIRARHGNEPFQWLPVLLREVQDRKSRNSRSAM